MVPVGSYDTHQLILERGDRERQWIRQTVAYIEVCKVPFYNISRCKVHLCQALNWSCMPVQSLHANNTYNKYLNAPAPTSAVTVSKFLPFTLYGKATQAVVVVTFSHQGAVLKSA